MCLQHSNAQSKYLSKCQWIHLLFFCLSLTWWNFHGLRLSEMRGRTAWWRTSVDNCRAAMKTRSISGRRRWSLWGTAREESGKISPRSDWCCCLSMFAFYSFCWFALWKLISISWLYWFFCLICKLLSCRSGSAASGWEMWGTFVTCLAPPQRTGLTVQWTRGPLAVLFHCHMCLACKWSARDTGTLGKFDSNIFTSSKGRSRIRRGLSSSTFVRLSWSDPATGAVMKCVWMMACVWLCVSCSGLMSLELKFHYIVVLTWLQVMEHPNFIETMDWILETPATVVRRPALLMCISCEKKQSGFDTCYIINFRHMSWRVP